MNVVSLCSLEEEEGEEWEYRQQLILTVLHNVTTRWQQHEVKPKEGTGKSRKIC